MKTKRLKKLLMGQCGLSRNQVNRMVKEQREASKKVSNAGYFDVLNKGIALMVASCGDEIIPYLTSFVLQ